MTLGSLRFDGDHFDVHPRSFCGTLVLSGVLVMSQTSLLSGHLGVTVVTVVSTLGHSGVTEA